MEVGQSIKKFREKRGMSQQDLATAINISQTSMSHIEQGKNEPRKITMKKISEALEVPLPFLFWDSVTVEDIPEHKRDSFNMLKPSVDALLNVFLEDDTEK